MPTGLCNLDSLEESARAIAQIIAEHAEWLYSLDKERESSPLRNTECDVGVQYGRLIFSCWGDAGARTWRVSRWEWTGEKLVLEIARKLGRESGRVELVPRASAALIAETVSEARLVRCLALARLAAAQVHRSKIEKARLSPGSRPGKPGRYARIVLLAGRERIAVTGIVAESKNQDIDSFLSHALIWFLRTRQAVRGPFVRSLWLVVSAQSAEALQRRIALLAEDLRSSIVLMEIDEPWANLRLLAERDLESFLAEPQQRLRISASDVVTESARGILNLDTNSIDRVRARHGETLRFNGLPFARVRRIMEDERVWFGLDRSRRKPLGEDTFREWDNMFADLSANRVAEQADKRHALYRALPEAWLESMLRRDVTKLDPGLIIAPLHAQFRTSYSPRSGSRPIDLLALREDGRLAVIELKVAEDIILTLQGAEYWMRVETHRRQGNIARARLFGDREIADEPPLVYLVGPTLRFHRAFSTLARCIRPEIEMYRFDINEDWRKGVRVMRRETSSINPDSLPMVI
jgi:hypothetical protein